MDLGSFRKRMKAATAVAEDFIQEMKFVKERCQDKINLMDRDEQTQLMDLKMSAGMTRHISFYNLPPPLRKYLFIELILHLLHEKQMYNQSIHLTHELM